jgi:hypothetical protein
MNIKVYDNSPRPPIDCPRPSKRDREPYVNHLSGEQVREGEEYITGPLRLIFVYKTEEKTKWGFYYQSLFDGQHLHAEEEEKTNDDGYRRIETRTHLILEEEVLAQFMAKEKSVWVDKDYDRWASISQAARDIVEDNILFIKTTIGPGAFYCPYLPEEPIKPSEKMLKTFGANVPAKIPDGLLL